jgi:hypothetical protein
MEKLTSHFIRLDAFNLWPGAVFALDDGEWAEDSLQVVQRVERIHDTEKVVVFHRDLNYLIATEDSPPGLPGREDAMIVGFCDPVLVFGNVVCFDDLNDNNTGVKPYLLMRASS